MPRKIKGSVRLPLSKGGAVLKAGDERKLAEADLPPETLQRLQKKGIISGFAADAPQEDEPPTIRTLKDILATKTREEVEAMAAADRRSSARPYYEARLNELLAEEGE